MRKSYPLTLLLTHVHHSIYYPFLSTIIVPPNKKICYTHHCVEYGRIKIFFDPCFPQLDNLQGFFVNLSKYGKIRVRGNPYSCIFCALHKQYPANIYLFKVNKRNTSKRYQICSHVIDVVLVLLLLTLNIFQTHFLVFYCFLWTSMC